MADWQRYERQIFRKFRREFPDADLQKNARLAGRFSGVRRQVDVLIKGSLAGHPLLGVVECKCFSHKIDVPDVDRFAGFLEDVKANFGVMITTRGYSKAAQSRAKLAVGDIRLHVVDLDELDEYDFSWDLCELCDPGEDHPPTLISWEGAFTYRAGGGGTAVLEMGRCDWCNGISVKCHRCRTYTGVFEGQYGEEMECLGGCGLLFRIEQEYRGSGLTSESIKLIHAGRSQRQRRRRS